MISISACWLYLFVTFTIIIQFHNVSSSRNRHFFSPNKVLRHRLSPQSSEVRRKIVLFHNFFRSKVRPTASNMLLMTWHPLAARAAQEHAEKCTFLQHNDPSERKVPYFGPCGQNILVSMHELSWFSAIRTWFLEYKNFTYGSPVPDLMAVGHYTQMVWATSHKVGCGVAHCDGGPWGYFYNYVCHYCPSGNYISILQYPYKAGRQCNDCPNNCLSGSLCTNSCPVRDNFSNCASLVTMPGYCMKGTCNATCECGNQKIHKNYPW